MIQLDCYLQFKKPKAPDFTLWTTVQFLLSVPQWTRVVPGSSPTAYQMCQKQGGGLCHSSAISEKCFSLIIMTALSPLQDACYISS